MVNNSSLIEQEIVKQSIHLKYLKFEMDNGIYSVTFHDLAGYNLVKGYGNTIIEAINDMHSCII